MACACPRLNRRMSFQRLLSSATKDAAGHVDESLSASWETYTRVSAAIVAKGSREFFGANQVRADVTHQITVRWSRTADAIEADMRVVDGDKTYNLSGPPFDPDGNRRQLKLNAIEVR